MVGEGENYLTTNQRNESAAMAAEEGRCDPVEPDRRRVQGSDSTSSLVGSLSLALPVLTIEAPASLLG